MSTDAPDLAALERVLGTRLDPALAEQALTHRSYAYENGGLPTNERLEFLGDAVLGLVVTDALYRTYPDLAESELAPLRSGVVSTRALARAARDLGLGTWVRLGRGEERSGGRDKASILADTLEAVLGAVYLTSGFATACDVVLHVVADQLAAVGTDDAARDWKTVLQEHGAASGSGVPEYRTTETGPPHERVFTAQVRLAGDVLGTGEGRTKKDAEQQAAEQAARSLGVAG